MVVCMIHIFILTVVSTAFTSGAGKCVILSDDSSNTTQPILPSVTITFLQPNSRKCLAADSASATV